METWACIVYGQPGRDFASFNLEQQASIVDDWFGGRGRRRIRPPTGKRARVRTLRYIRDNIRKRILLTRRSIRFSSREGSQHAESGLWRRTGERRSAAPRPTYRTRADGGAGRVRSEQSQRSLGRSTGDGLGSAGSVRRGHRWTWVAASSEGSVGVDAKPQTGPAAVRAVHAGNGPGVLGVSKGQRCLRQEHG